MGSKQASLARPFAGAYTPSITRSPLEAQDEGRALAVVAEGRPRRLGRHNNGQGIGRRCTRCPFLGGKRMLATYSAFIFESHDDH